MKKGWLLVTVVMAAFVLTACGGATKTITTDEGTVTTNVGNTTSWCQTGADWNYQGNDGQEGSWKIVELVSGGKYDGLCHVTFNGMGTDMDYYFNEDGETGYVEMVMPNGQKVSQSWSK
ncbi:MAG: hypothetical protein PHR51_00365 [Patescibacteria group bacterium]|nr:hypothetical protein [Patescibacteria group bacterium]